MNNVNFGMDGLVLDNTVWYNSKTGDSFKVRSNYFENNQMILQAVDGRSFSLDQLNDYVQWQGSGMPPKDPVEESRPATLDDLPPEIASEILADADDDSNYMTAEDMNMIAGANKPMYIGAPMNTSGASTPLQTKNYDIIDRALSKTKQPGYAVLLKWTKFPSREIEMLTDVMDIDLEEIVEYYMDNISIKESVIESLRKQVSKFIKEKINKDESKTTAVTKKSAK